MDSAFPFGFPFATAAYMALYVLTLVVHVVFMNYVLAGSAYLAVVAVWTGGEETRRQKTPMALMLRDWMPFVLSAAITAGVAPLLFIQILYKKQFYSANLLLFHRWMIIVPVLIVGFYLLYLLKSRVIGQWRSWVRMVVGLGAFLCFAFTAYSWTENHLLSTQEDIWPGFYASDDWVFRSPVLLPRLGVWFLGALPTMAVLVSWQLWAAARRGEPVGPAESRRAGWIAIGGIVLAALCAAWYATALTGREKDIVTGRLGGIYLMIAVVGLLLQLVGWIGQLRSTGGGFSFRWLAVASVGCFMTIIGATVAREALRLASVEVVGLYDLHARASEVGGFVVFLFFAVVNTVLVVWCFRLVGRGRVVRDDSL
jgi:hypothetical protein